MVGLVIVSHSAKLAEGVAELARGMAGPDVKIAATGGLALPDRPLGTDAELIFQAIEQVYSDDGVLVLMDLGSAILSAEMALEQIDEEKRTHIALCDAPIVEGAVAAAVQARLGSRLEQVAAEARGALAPKAEQLGTQLPPLGALPSGPPGAPSEDTHQLQLTVRNRLGLHARPAARFVQTAASAQADVRIRNLTTGRGPVNAKSINAVATLGVRQGHEIEVTASGAGSEAVLEAIRALAGANFGDKETPGQERRAIEQTRAPAGLAGSLQGLPASPGIAIGPAHLFHPSLAHLPEQLATDPQYEWDALAGALQKTRAEIQKTRDAVARRADNYSAAIFEAHLLFLEDQALLEPARRAIFEQHLNAAAAWQRAVDAVASDYRALEDEYISARAADIVDVGNQVLLNLLGAAAPAPTFTAPGVLIASDLTPAETANLDPAFVLGICTALGAPTSHSAILARTFGIPAVVGLGQGILALGEGTPLVVDGDAGRVFVKPNPSLIVEYDRKAESARLDAERARSASSMPALTHDGRRIEVVANIGSLADARAAVVAGADGVGLFRTEFLFLDRRTAPDEDQQYAAYRAAAEALDKRPVIVRTLDVGGDKPLPYLAMEPEANPFLGWRAIRLCLARPEFFQTQLRAIVRVAAEFPVKLMFPMIATLDEWRAARDLLLEARDQVQRRGDRVPDRIEAGIMVEIPAAALRASQFAVEVDFFSIGTNDLTQYTLAAERGNARVASLADAFQPAVLTLIWQVVEAAHTSGKWVGVCGEFAGDPLAVPLLVGLGVDELSMNPPAVPRAKQIIRALDYASAQTLAQRALEQETPEAVRAMLRPESTST